MKSSGPFLGTLCIVAVLGAGLWYANDPEVLSWPGFAPAAAQTKAWPEFHVNRFDWSADGRLLLCTWRGGPDAESRLTLHDVICKTTVAYFDDMEESISVAALAPDGRHVLVGSYAGHLWWIATDSSEFIPPLVELPRGSAFFSATAITRDGRQVAAATSNGLIYIVDPVQRRSVTLTSPSQGAIIALQFSHDGSRLVSAQHDGRICVWELSQRKSLREIVADGHSPRTVELFSDGERAISGGLDSTVRIWDITSGCEMWRADFGCSGINALAVSPDGLLAAWGGIDHRVVVWDLRSGRKKFEIITPASGIYHLQFSPDGSLLATAGSEATIRLYDALTGASRGGVEIDAADGARTQVH